MNHLLLPRDLECDQAYNYLIVSYSTIQFFLTYTLNFCSIYITGSCVKYTWPLGCVYNAKFTIYPWYSLTTSNPPNHLFIQSTLRVTLRLRNYTYDIPYFLWVLPVIYFCSSFYLCPIYSLHLRICNTTYRIMYKLWAVTRQAMYTHW
jgi:hypothetical protein